MTNEAKTSDRTGPVTPEELATHAERLERFSTKLNAIAAGMRADGIESVVIDGVTKLDRAAEEVTKYVGQLQKSLLKEEFRV